MSFLPLLSLAGGGGSPERANEMAELIGVGGARSPDNSQSDSQDSIAVSNP